MSSRKVLNVAGREHGDDLIERQSLQLRAAQLLRWWEGQRVFAVHALAAPRAGATLLIA